MKRIRNHPSLVMWGAGNESDKPFGPAIDMMGRLSLELDGSRPFHRGEAWGGSDHNYNCWWDDAHLNHNLNMTSPFWGEFGIASLPHIESVRRYLAEEKDRWPSRPGDHFRHHTPIYYGVSARTSCRSKAYVGTGSYFVARNNRSSLLQDER